MGNPAKRRTPRRSLADSAHQQGRFAEVVRLLQGNCQTAGEYEGLGIALNAVGRDTEAEAAYHTSIALDPASAPAHYNLGNLLHGLGRNAEAIAKFEQALVLRPDHAGTWNNLGRSLQEIGRLEEALATFRRAVEFVPDSAILHANLGTLLFALNRNAEASEELYRALRLDPSYSIAHGNLGALLGRSGYPIAAETACRNALALDPTNHRWLINLGVALLSQGRHAESEACYRQALTLRPDYANGHGNLLFALGYRTDVTPEAIFAEYQDWNRRYAAPLASPPASFDRNTTPNRRLRVGYVSADFRKHAVALFAEPLLAAHDHTNVELFLYSGVAAEDATTERFRALCDHWRSTLGLSDAKLAETIRGDKIDVLIDLSGHSAGNRLLTFARRAAPVQVAYLVGHGYTSGLSAMDAFLADAALAPPGADTLFSERLVRLPRIPIAYPPRPMACRLLRRFPR